MMRYYDTFSALCIVRTFDGDDETAKVDAGEFSRQFKRVRTIASMQQDSGGEAA